VDNSAVTFEGKVISEEIAVGASVVKEDYRRWIEVVEVSHQIKDALAIFVDKAGVDVPEGHSGHSK
jgi:hypothetical protein